MTEHHTIHLPVIRYRDKDGNPTCAADFETGDVCKCRGWEPVIRAYLQRQVPTQGTLTLCSVAMGSGVTEPARSFPANGARCGRNHNDANHWCRNHDNQPE